MNDVSVVYLAWCKLGLEPFLRFVASYRRHNAGRPHTLFIVLKEFPDEPTRQSYVEHLQGIPFTTILMPESCLDIPAYFLIAKHLSTPYVCFLNSNSEILADDWLSKLHTHVVRPGIGVAGATGSWESHLNVLLANCSRAGLNRTLPPDAQLRSKVLEVAGAYPPFPNYHLRTNGFMISRELFLSLSYSLSQEKEQCLQFESGWSGLTRQLLARGLTPLIVARDGSAYEKERWDESRTFRLENQPNLLIADNQTRVFSQYNDEVRRAVSFSTWGLSVQRLFSKPSP